MYILLGESLSKYVSQIVSTEVIMSTEAMPQHVQPMVNIEELFGRCPYVTAQKVLAGKWTLLIMHELENGPVRFKALERALQPITQATLTRQLRAMEEDGLIGRKVYSQIPPKVEYYLTPIGESFKNVLGALEVWGTEYVHWINEKEAN